MAIRGKGKTKSKTVARPPRRDPVPSPVPFAQRRWVAVTAAFLLGLGVYLFAIWLTNGLRSSDEQERAAAELTQQQLALQSWQAEVESQIGTLGTLRDPSPPDVGTSLRAALKDLKRGTETSVTVPDLSTTAEAFEGAASDLEGYDLSGEITGEGFGAAEADSILTSRLEYIESFRAFRTATLLVTLAIGTDDKDLRATLVERATESLATADALLGDAHRKFRLSLATVGIVTAAALQP